MAVAQAVRNAIIQPARAHLAFKWIRILFRCWQDRRPYDEAQYLDALRKRHSPLLKFAAEG